ncbi:tRNA 2-selenouridine synthase [Maritimibacter alkaliphilus HTCC2654]|uniref:Rhodanese-like protein n=1 Tax=Maritimibacter alkaliphilus HTCC2654 TaxID=314271 RepID=A3VFY0_9RHOB|nr:tRNA 2-selenouridine(34) synthase MnmH [Maritimibacter alkaliphilus]EAQ12756.1 Rhodanese-like protein [Rhodobacterales bacterium HTCC2654] [Maritimibacter alkaliphilus HTCC2654]TYP78741.1 tRNA 2-selenouridine synthase [Maritimibacter alkaliphilus HTCC2654]
MSVRITSLSDLAALGFDDIIDARSPSEYAEDRIPGAISLPVLNDEERAQVGTIYVQEDPFKARKIGAALVARNAATHIQGPLADREGGWKPLVYCWRGGQRSNSFASILSQIGWRADVIEGGYRTYRRLVVDMLHRAPLPHRLMLIDGGTGTAKTRLLHHIAAAGGQVLDLEGLASHRGSLFGMVGEEQPSQKAFESGIAMALTRLDPKRVTFVEAESSKVGDLLVPPALWKAMLASPYVEVTAPIAARAEHLVTSYPDIVDDADRLARTLDRLVKYHGRDVVGGWHELAQDGNWAGLAHQLVETHYDPRYKRIRREAEPERLLDLADLTDATLAEAAKALVASV